MSSEKPLKAPGSEKKAKKDKSKKRKLEVADDVAPEPIEESKPKKSKLKSKDNSMSDLNVSSEVVPAPGIDTGDKKSKDKSKKRKLDAAEEEASEFVKDPTPKRSKRKVEIVDEDVYFQEMREKRKRMQEKKDGLLAELEDVEDCVVEPPADDVVVGAESSKSIKREKKDKKDKKAKKTAEKSDDALASNEDEVSLQVLPKEEIEVAKSADSSKSRKKDKKGKKTAEGFIDALASNADEVTLVREKPKKEKKMKESSQVKDDAHEGESAPAVEEVAVDKKSKKDKKAKKTGGDDAVKINGVNAAEDVKSSEKKEKNEKMSKKAKGVVGDEKAIQQNDGADSAGDANVDEDAEVVEQPTSDKKGKKNGPKSRFIAFVGMSNLHARIDVAANHVMQATSLTTSPRRSSKSTSKRSHQQIFV